MILRRVLMGLRGRGKGAPRENEGDPVPNLSARAAVLLGLVQQKRCCSRGGGRRAGNLRGIYGMAPSQ